MLKWFVIQVFVVSLIISGSSASAADKSACADNDQTCREFAKLFKAEQYEQIIKKIDPKKTYSEPTRKMIGQAFLMVAGNETNTPEQEEMYCKKALEYGATSAYMGLYFIHAVTNPTEAIGYLKQYIATDPQDSVPYMILGESEFENKNYAAAREYLMNAKKTARGQSSDLDWLLFQVNYLTGHHDDAAAMLDSSFSHGKTIGDLKALIAADPRFNNIGSRPEFKKFYPLLNGTKTAKLYIRS